MFGSLEQGLVEGSSAADLANFDLEVYVGFPDALWHVERDCNWGLLRCLVVLSKTIRSRIDSILLA